MTDRMIPALPAQSVSAIYAGLESQRKLERSLPYLRDGFGILYVALTSIILAYGGIFGFGAILVLYGMWLPKIIYKGVFLLRPTREVVITMLFPLFGVFSILWSREPVISLYNSLEYTSLIICTLIISKIVRTEAYIKGLIIGFIVVLLASVSSGRYGVDPFSGNWSLVGYFGSKNMIGLFSEIGIFMSILGFYICQGFFKKCIFYIMPLIVFTVTLYLSKSASSVLSLTVVLGIVIAAYFITKLPRSFRLPTCVVAVTLIIFVTMTGFALGWQEFVFKSFGKDSTLTGRTHLWEMGLEAGSKAPILGYGYGAFWIPGQPIAEKLWFEYTIPGKSGFHFHNLFVETFVELGLIGLLLISWLILINTGKSLKLLMRYGLSVEYLFGLGISVIFLIRAFVEVDLVGTFNIGPLLFYSILPRLNQHMQDKNSELPLKNNAAFLDLPTQRSSL